MQLIVFILDVKELVIVLEIASALTTGWTDAEHVQEPAILALL